MILFYSDFCPHCRMLLDTIKRHDSKGAIKLVSIEALRAQRNAVPPQIHSVPALLLPGTKQFLYGKHVFDYLLLPGSGKLLVPAAGFGDANAGNAGGANGVAAAGEGNGDGNGGVAALEPSAFSMFGGGYSDNFAAIDDNAKDGATETPGCHDRAYRWASIQDTPIATVNPAAPFAEETRSKKATLDLDAYKAQRELEINGSDINVNTLIPPTFTR